MIKKKKKNLITESSASSQNTRVILPSWIRQISSVVSELSNGIDHLLSANCGDEAVFRATRLVRLWEVFAQGGAKLGVHLHQKQLQEGIKKYLGIIVARYLGHQKSFHGVEAQVQLSLNQNMLLWKRKRFDGNRDSLFSGIEDICQGRDRERGDFCQAKDRENRGIIYCCYFPVFFSPFCFKCLFGIVLVANVCSQFVCVNPKFNRNKSSLIYVRALSLCLLYLPIIG